MSEPPSAGRPRVGLVLGAGGAAGLAYHAGALLALEQDLGWDPRAADVVVGTSAGSIVGALLRAGLSTDDLAAWGSEVEPLEDGRANREVLDEVADSPMRLRLPVLRNPLSATRMAVEALTGRVNLSTALMAALPFGPLDARATLERFGALNAMWPDDPLWLPAVRMVDGRRIVFGRDRSATVGQAVAASCAIPGVYRPVSIAGRRYIDGGAHSPNNADLLAVADVDLAIVLSPMSTAESFAGLRPDKLVRGVFAGLLDRECDVLRKAGVEVAVFEPDGDTLDAMGINMLDRTRTRRIVSRAFLGTGAQISPALRERLTGTATDPISLAS